MDAFAGLPQVEALSEAMSMNQKSIMTLMARRSSIKR